MERIDRLIAESRVLRAEAAEARAKAQEVRWRAEQAQQRARVARQAWQEIQQRPRRTPFGCRPTYHNQACGAGNLLPQHCHSTETRGLLN